jgi:predicted metal-dependent hydrolase
MTAAEREHAMRRGVDLFNHGYFWEAHEAWEDPWRSEPRESPRKIYFQSLIRLAAAALKLRIGELRGAALHGSWCADRLKTLSRSAPGLFVDGPSADVLIGLGERLAAGTERFETSPESAGMPVLATVLVLRQRQ